MPSGAIIILPTVNNINGVGSMLCLLGAFCFLATSVTVGQTVTAVGLRAAKFYASTVNSCQAHVTT